MLIQLVWRQSTLILRKKIIQIQRNRIKNPNLAGGNQLAIYKSGQGFQLGTTENRSSKWPQQDSNLELLDCKSD